MIRATYDQTYDGYRTGRYRWDQLFKTEKTHFGTLIEIDLRREFEDIISDGQVLDYRINGVEVDCKFSQSMGGWMVPPEAMDHYLLVVTASDISSTWSLGFVRASEDVLRDGANRDAKRSLSAAGREHIVWVGKDHSFKSNILNRLAPPTLDAIFTPPSGQKRINQLFRLVQGERISRVVVATVAQQEDYMKRIRDNGGARQHLRPEGILIFGDWKSHAVLLNALGLPALEKGDSMSVRVEPCPPGTPDSMELQGQHWRIANPASTWHGDAPILPSR